MNENYTIHGGELSYFTRKLEAAMIFYGLDFDMQNKNIDNRQDIELRSGTHQIPVLHTPEDWMLADTTPILHLLDERIPARRLFPGSTQGILVQVIEEYFDEWVARTMVHYRWHYSRSAEFASQKMANGDQAIAKRMLSWGPRACRATGTDSQHQRSSAEDEYLRILTAMEAQLGTTPYMLGDRPTAVDCILLGGLRAHTHMDPDPKEVTAQFPRVVAWTEGGADSWDGSGTICDLDQPTPFASFVIEEMARTYKPYILANKDAQLAGAKAFHTEMYGEDVSYLSRPYPERSRQMIIERITSQLDTVEQDQVRSWLNQVHLAECFL